MNDTHLGENRSFFEIEDSKIWIGSDFARGLLSDPWNLGELYLDVIRQGSNISVQIQYNSCEDIETKGFKGRIGFVASSLLGQSAVFD